MTTFAIVLLVLLQVLLMLRVSYRNAGLFAAMLASLMLRIGLIVAVFPRTATESSDSLMYFEQARSLAASAGSFSAIFHASAPWGTSLISGLAACVLRIAGPSLTGVTLAFALPAFWGSYFYYRAFQEAFPRGNPHLAAIGFFLYPSIVFWTAPLGKDGLVFLSLSAAAYARARLASRRKAGLWLALLAGIAGCSLIRPHIGALAMISMAASFMFGGKRSRHKVSKAVLTVLLAALSVVLVYLCARLLQLTNMEDAQQKAELSSAVNRQESSGFEQSSHPLYRLVCAPLLLVRPFPWETDGPAAEMASAEGLLLFAVACVRRKRLRDAIRSSRAAGLTVYLEWFVVLNLILLGLESSNFGLLVRERVMILPAIAVFILGSFGDSRPPRSRHGNPYAPSAGKNAACGHGAAGPALS